MNNVGNTYSWTSSLEISVQHQLAQELEFKELVYNFTCLKARMVCKTYR
jgi:hypothetical protein